MSESVTPATPDSRRSAAVWVIAIVVVVVIVGGFWWAVTQAAASRSVEDLLASAAEINPVESTADLCQDSACVEGWRTDVGVYLRFEKVGAAEYWATVLGDDGRRADYIVLDMTGFDNSFDERRVAVDVLFAWRDWT